MLREAGKASVELIQLGLDMEVAQARRKLTEARRLRREQRSLRVQLIFLERRLEELASHNGHDSKSPPSPDEILRSLSETDNGE